MLLYIDRTNTVGRRQIDSPASFSASRYPAGTLHDSSSYPTTPTSQSPHLLEYQSFSGHHHSFTILTSSLILARNVHRTAPRVINAPEPTLSSPDKHPNRFRPSFNRLSPPRRSKPTYTLTICVPKSRPSTPKKPCRPPRILQSQKQRLRFLHRQKR